MRPSCHRGRVITHRTKSRFVYVRLFKSTRSINTSGQHFIVYVRHEYKVGRLYRNENILSVVVFDGLYVENKNT